MVDGSSYKIQRDLELIQVMEFKVLIMVLYTLEATLLLLLVANQQWIALAWE